MFAVRIHGRGGQGAVTAAELLSVAAFDEGRHAQALPDLRLRAHRRAGGRRSAASTTGRSGSHEPDHRPRRGRGAGPDPAAPGRPVRRPGRDGFVLVNTSRPLARARPRRPGPRAGARQHVVTVPATEIAREHLGRPLPNTALLGAFAALTGEVSLDAVCTRDPGAVPRRGRRGQRPRRRGRSRARPVVDEEAGRCLARSRVRRRSPVRSPCAGPQVVAAYPISPQTHIVEALSDRVAHRRAGARASTSWSSPSSARMSACIGASAAGARTYTATSSQGLLFMAEALFNASGLGLPIVMTVANRAIGAPINIWNDHSDAHVDARLRLDAALRRVQPGGRRPARPGVPRWPSACRCR